MYIAVFMYNASICISMYIYIFVGKVYTVGRGEYGRLGHGDSNEEKRVPAILDLPPCKQVAAGQAVSYAVTNSGKLCHLSPV